MRFHKNWWPALLLVSSCGLSGCGSEQVAPQLAPPIQPTTSPSPTQPPVELPATQPEAFEETQSSLPLKLPAPPVRRRVNDPRIAAIQSKLAKFPTFAAYRKLAELYLELEMFPEAAAAFRGEAQLASGKGLTDAAIILENRAARHDTDVQMLVERKATAAERQRLDSGAPLEPPVGCYIGAFIDRDDHLPRVFQGDNWQWHRYPNDFAQRAGKPHATYFMYLSYKNGFPKKWLELCKQQNVIPHIAWEPQNLGEVRDDEHLRSFAKALGALDWPVFIRFASEMNGEWTPYHENPQLYREKFRLVHRVLHQYAPKVATIWCVGGVLGAEFEKYYPGDDACDWVGVNLYSTPFLDNDRKREAFLDSPLTLLDPIYKEYSARKPIAICEYGASHCAAVDGVQRTDFAIEKMSLLYGALPALYPRVKMISWYDNNNLKNAQPGRQLNNYNLTEIPTILNTYRQLIKPDYFIGTPSPEYSVPPLPMPLQAGQSLTGQTRFVVWVKTYTARPTIVMKLGDDIVYAGRQFGAHRVALDLRRFRAGDTELTVFVYDNKNRFVTSVRRKVRLANSKETKPDDYI